MIQKQTLELFQKELASKSPTPGGGVVAGLSAQFAASLIEMVCNLTIDKKGYENRQKDLIKIQKRISEIKKRLVMLTDEDAKAYDKVLMAYRLPSTDQKRKEAIKKSLKYAIEVPFEVRRFAIEIEKIAYRVSKIGNKNAISDAKTAVHLSRAAAKSAQENIKINKQSLKKLG